MKDCIDFYQHYADADQHPKFKMLRVQFGWAGEGQFWALNNRIAQAENCCLDLSKKYNKAAIVSDLGFTIKEFDEFIEYLLHDCELIMECEPGVITTDIIQENFQKVQVNREKARDRKQRSLEKVSKGSVELLESSPDQNNKGKESKGKESKNTLPEGNESKLEVSTPACPHDDIRILYNQVLPELPTCTLRNKTVDGYTRARWREDPQRQSIEWWNEFFHEVKESDFLMGKTKNPFTCSFDWLVKPTNFTKVINGNYKNKTKGNSTWSL